VNGAGEEGAGAEGADGGGHICFWTGSITQGTCGGRFALRHLG
jgi:hypothetical protein